MNKIITLTINYVKNYTRNRSILIGSIVFPLVFVAVFGIAFQYSAPGTETISIGVIVNDNGIPENAIVPFSSKVNLTEHQISELYMEILENVTYEDNITRIFEITEYNIDNESKALEDLDTRKIYALLYLDEDFSLGYMASIREAMDVIPGIASYTNNWDDYPETEYTTELVLKGDQTLQAFSITSSVINEITRSFFSLGNDIKGVSLSIEGSYSTQGLTTFDMVLPGIVMFALLLNLAVVAQSSLRDVESGLIQRLKISRIKNWEYTLSIIIGQLLVSLGQIPIMFGVGIMFGYPINTGILLAFVFAILISLSVSGIGLMISGIVSNTDAAGTVANMISTPMAFLSSAFFMVPNPEVFSFGEQVLRLFDILPSTLAIESLRLALLSGYGIGDLMYQFLALIVLSIIYLGLGIFLYTRKHLVAN